MDYRIKERIEESMRSVDYYDIIVAISKNDLEQSCWLMCDLTFLKLRGVQISCL